MSKKETSGLTDVIKSLKSQSKETLDALENIAERVERLESNDTTTQKTLASFEMRMRDMEIKLRSEKGEKNIALARKFNLTEGRISQIINN